jgi:hypothetical protein
MRRQLFQAEKDRPYHIFTFEGVAEAVAEVRSLRKRGRAAHMDGDLTHGSPDRWFGRADLTTLEDGLRFAGQEWPAGQERLRKCAEKLGSVTVADPESMARVPTWREQDGDFDLDRFSSGRDAFRGANRRKQNRNQFVTILVSCGGNCNRTEESLGWQAALAVVMATKLEAANYSVELWSYDAGVRTYRSGDHSLTAIRLKEANDPIDTVSVGNAMSAWFFRTVHFALYDCVEEDRPSEGLGRRVKMRSELVPFITPDRSVIVIDDVTDLSGCVELLRRSIAAVNTEVD